MKNTSSTGHGAASSTLAAAEPQTPRRFLSTRHTIYGKELKMQIGRTKNANAMKKKAKKKMHPTRGKKTFQKKYKKCKRLNPQQNNAKTKNASAYLAPLISGD